MHDILDDPRYHDNLLDDFLHLHNTRNLDHLLNDLLHHHSHLLNDFLFEDDGHWDFSHYFNGHLLAVWDPLLDGN